MPDGFWPIDTVCKNQDVSGFENEITAPNNDDLKIIDGDVAYLKPAKANPFEISDQNGKLQSTNGWTWMGYIKVDNAKVCCIVDYRSGLPDGIVHMCNFGGSHYINGIHNNSDSIFFEKLVTVTNRKVFFAFAHNKADSKVLSALNNLTQEKSVHKTEKSNQNSKHIRLGGQCTETNLYIYSMAYYNQYLTSTQIQEEKKRLQVQTGMY